jgi:hypothetical protein
LKTLGLIIASCFFSTFLFGQSSKYFQVEFDAFEPPVKDMINHVEGKPAKNFMMKDLNGKDLSLSSLKGKKVILWFWDNSDLSASLTPILDFKCEQNPTINFVGLYNGTKEEYLSQFQQQWKFKVLPNAAFIGEAIYDKELGTPRIYLIDEKGIVKMVIPTSYMSSLGQVSDVVENFIKNRIH